MSTLFGRNPANAGLDRRWTVGIEVSSRCSDAAASVIAAEGHGLGLQATVRGTSTTELPRETALLFRNLRRNGSAMAGSIATLRAQLAEAETRLVRELLAGASAVAGRVLAVGVHDPGLWTFGRSGPTGYLGLCDAARLAAWTGLNVIEALPARDVARGGQGGPITPLAEWILLRAPTRTRVLLDLGRTIRISYLPTTVTAHAASRILSFEVGPGTSLLDRLAARLTGGQHCHDPGGRLAVQGRRIGELVAHWAKDPYFDRPLPRWDPRGVRPERFLTDALQMAVDRDWSVRDVLCTATHFIAEAIARALQRRVPPDGQVDEIVVTGGGQQNGMLLREISRQTATPLVRADDLGLPSEAFGAACVAVMALLYLDHVPGNSTAVTGTRAAGLLGQLTPGSAENWQRLLQASASSSPAARQLRPAS